MSKGYEEYIVQERVIRPEATRYLRERILTPAGQGLLASVAPAELPAVGAVHSPFKAQLCQVCRGLRPDSDGAD